MSLTGLRFRFDYHGQKLRLSPRSVISKLLYLDRSFEEDEIRQCLSFLDRDSVVIDIGANIGIHTIRFAQACPDGLVVSFEPSTDTAADLVANVAGLGNVIIMTAGLSDRAGIADFYVASDDAYSGLKDTGRKPVRSVRKVACYRLDDLVPALALPRIDLVKIDVEGHERQVLSGMRAVIDTYRPVIFCEIYAGTASNPAPDETVRDVVQLGYDAFVSMNGTLVPFVHHDDRHFNYFFIPRNRP